MDAKVLKRQKTRYHIRIKEAKEKLGNKCINCGDIENLEFDHINNTTKVNTISGMIRSNWSETEIEVELAKCQLLCHICHKEKHSSKNKHGTLSAYRYCKCDLCKAAKARYMREYKMKK